MLTQTGPLVLLFCFCLFVCLFVCFFFFLFFVFFCSLPKELGLAALLDSKDCRTSILPSSFSAVTFQLSGEVRCDCTCADDGNAL